MNTFVPLILYTSCVITVLVINFDPYAVLQYTCYNLSVWVFCVVYAIGVLLFSYQHKFTEIATRFQEEFAYVGDEEDDSFEN